MKSKHLLAAAFSCVLACGAQSWGAEKMQTADISTRGLKTSDFPRWKQLEPGIYAYEGLFNEDPGGVHINIVSLIVVTPEGVVVVDGQEDVPQAKLMVENIRKLTPQPIKYVVIASDHADHVAGNPAFKAAYPDVVFISSPVSKAKLASEHDPNVPTETVSTSRTLKMGGTEIRILNIGRAHTGGDLVVYLPQSKVLFLGEIYLRQVFPAMRTAFPSEWIATIEKAQAMDVSWYVPGHGFIDDAATMKRDLEESKKATQYVITEAKRLRAAGLPCKSDTDCAAADKANWGVYGNWALRSLLDKAAIAKVYQEIDGKLPKLARQN